ncbi:MAG: hypothetical protein NW201_10665 [Gemmatimonadales bacterium]|nr:hypothetical protein [Gemmatimonadales bacterium]
MRGPCCLALVASVACSGGAKPPAASQASSDVGPAAAPRPFTFASPELGWRVQLPAAWRGRVETSSALGPLAATQVPRAEQVAEFLYQPADTSLRAVTLLRLAAFPAEAWQALGARRAAAGDSIGAAGGTVVAARLLAGGGYPAGTPDAVALDALRAPLALDSLRAGFTGR